MGPWADDVKSKGFHFMDSWHFVDREVNPDGLITDMREGTSAVDALANIKHTLIKWVKNYKRGGSAFINLPASMFTRMAIHIVLDLHQPLHCSTLIDQDHLPNDRGGNKFMVKFNNKIVNLHAFWDSGAFVWKEFQ